MRLKHKKFFISGIAVTVAGVLGVGALLQTSVSVQASSAMMPGVEQIVNDATADKPFRILEIVDKTNEAEIGYYVSGQEPYIKLYNYTYTYKDENGEEHQKTIPINTLEEGLKKIASASQRKEFATNTKEDGSDTGIKNIQNISYQNDSSGEEKDYPLSYTPYEERYFLTSEQENSKEWTPITFEDAETEAGRTDTVKVKGKYQPNSDGTGDYTKQEQTYYPIRRDSETDKTSTEKYRENIQNFFFSDNGEANEPYFLEFEEVDNSSVNEAFDENNNKKNGNAILQEYDYTKGGYGYYENVYGNLTEEIVNNISNGSYLFPGETPQIDMTHAVKVPVESGNQTTNAKSFTDGTDDFSTIDEADTATQETGQPGISADSDQFGSAAENAFSSGDFSDGDTGNVSDTGNADGAQMQDPDSAADADTGIDSGIATEADSGQTTVIENDKIQPLISYTQEIKGDTTKIDSSVGTSKNPKVYFGITTDQYPYYEYTLLSDMKKIVACAKRNKAEVENGTYTPDASDKEHNITFQDDQYWYWTIDQQGNITKNPIFVVTCRQPVSYDNVQKLPETLQYNYYYKVKQAYFCCKTDENDSENEHAYKYFGWYSPGYPKDEDVYVSVKDGETATHYISAAEYKLTPEVGDYDFVPDDNEEETTVEVNHMYYRGGYTNHDWFKRYVFHINLDDEKEKEKYASFNIEVKTITSAKFNEMYGTAAATEGLNDTDTQQTDASTENAAFSDEPDTEFTDDESADTFSAGEIKNSTDSSDLSKYDLVYMNGSDLNEASFKALASLASKNKFPCIVNQPQLAANTDFVNAFGSFINNEDADQHYVTKSVYFFRNTFANQDPSSLLSGVFHTNFNLGSDSDISDGMQGETQGFEEILEYIANENKYRQLGKSSEDNITDDSQQISAPDSPEELLNTELSHARAIEYIINYKLKRAQVTKDKINVLELQPARSSGEITKSEIMGWLGYMTVTTCCNNKDSGNLLPKDDSVWISDETIDHVHYVQFDFAKEVDIDGFIYTTRKNIGETKKGVLDEYKVELCGEDGNIIFEKEGSTHYNWYNIDTGEKIFKFDQTVRSVKRMKIYFTNTFGDYDGQQKFWASASRMLPIVNENDSTIDITTMTTSEFVGHIEDINTKYDMIYLGDDDTDLNYDANFRPDNTILYYHIGGSKKALYELQGLMNHDYIRQNGTILANTVGETDSETGTMIGSVRGSGNDLTENIKNKLVDFVKSGYPVVVAGNIYNPEKQEISTELIDSSSYVYDFLNEVKTYSNVYRESEIGTESGVDFFASLPKPKIKFADGDSFPPSVIGDENGPANNYLAGDNMTFRFQIIDEAQASPANADYNCELYIDLNCDGNYSASEKLNDIVVLQNGSALKSDKEGKYHLSLKTEYTVSREIPQEYIKLMPWKLVVTSNSNSEIRTSEIGYTKRRKSDAVNNTIKVLQIQPDRYCTWDLPKDENFKALFNAVKQDFDVKIDGVTVSKYEENYKNNSAYLDQYHMLIVGFCDGEGYGGRGPDYTGYNGNFTEQGVQGILDFANTGKSVILAHDNTSSSNYDDDASKNKLNDNGGGGIWKGWAYYFNKKLRSVSGMDRYGITATETSDILKQARNLTITDSVWNTILSNSDDMAYRLNSQKMQTYSETQGFTNGKLRIAVRDRKQLAKTDPYYEAEDETHNPTTTEASQVNQGAISEYPYKINQTIPVAETHFQYYQLAMEEDSDNDGNGDIVVWYCLGNEDNTEGNFYYDHTPNDVRNNYYIYSYKNIIYTGVGHSNVNNDDDMEKKLFVNTIIAAYNAQAVKPNLSFVKQSDWNAEEAKNVYYILDYTNDNQSQELVKDIQDFHLKVTDSNLVGTSFSGTNTKDLKLELFIESDDEDTQNIEGIDKKVKEVKLPIYTSGTNSQVPADTNGDIYVHSGKVYDFTLGDLQKYLRNNANEYRGKTTLYARISCRYLYYGVEKEAQSIAKIDICQRQLFDLD